MMLEIWVAVVEIIDKTTVWLVLTVLNSSNSRKKSQFLIVIIDVVKLRKYSCRKAFPVRNKIQNFFYNEQQAK